METAPFFVVIEVANSLLYLESQRMEKLQFEFLRLFINWTKGQMVLVTLSTFHPPRSKVVSPGVVVGPL